VSNEIGRRLKVSELREGTVVVVMKQGRPSATMWVWGVTESLVLLMAGEVGMTLILARCGPDLEQVEDDSRAPMVICEYLGEI
jgi:hypothetical protein